MSVVFIIPSTEKYNNIHYIKLFYVHTYRLKRVPKKRKRRKRVKFPRTLTGGHKMPLHYYYFNLVQKGNRSSVVGDT